MAYWNTSELAYLEQHAGEGAAAIAEALGRSVSSVTHQAQRWGVSLQPRQVCPKCGLATRLPLSSKTGWCRACTLELSRDRASRRNAEIRAEVKAEERRIQALERDRQRLYADTHRRKKELEALRESGNEAEKPS